MIILDDCHAWYGETEFLSTTSLLSCNEASALVKELNNQEKLKGTFHDILIVQCQGIIGLISISMRLLLLHYSESEVH